MLKEDWLDLETTEYRTILDLRTCVEGDLSALGHYQYDHAMPPIPEQQSAKRLVFGFLKSGLQRYRVDGQDLILRGGQGIRFLPGSVYGSADLPEQRGEFYWLTIDVPSKGSVRLPGYNEEAADLWWTRAVDTDLPTVFPISSQLDSRLNRLFQTQLPSTDPIVVTEFSMHCGLLLLSIYHMMGSKLDQHTSKGVIKSLKYLEQNLSNSELVASKLASAAGMSSSYFHTRFKLETGLPPADYIRHRRIIEAQRILTQPNPPKVTDLAMNLGFSSSQYFATVFKRYTRVTPSEWISRNQINS